MTTPSTAGSATALEIGVVDPLADSDWDRWVTTHPESNPFHRSAWARVLMRAYGHRPRYIRIHRRGQSVALLPLMEVDSLWTGRRGVCLPFADECGLLLFEPIGSRLIQDVLQRLGNDHGWKHVELRGATGVPAEAPPSATFFGHRLDLRGGPDRVWDGFDPAVHRALRKADREGLTVDVRTDRQAMRAFVSLHARTRRRHGLPPQPDRFFDAIREELLETGLGAVVLASRADAPVAAAVFLRSGRQAIYKFGASDDRVPASRANNLVMWRGLQWLMDCGAAEVSFGRTSCPQDGLRRYKRGWGAVESPLHYHTLALPDAAWTRARPRDPGISSHVFSRLPLAANRLLGAALYPHLD